MYIKLEYKNIIIIKWKAIQIININSYSYPEKMMHDDEFFEYPTAYYMRNALKCNDNIQYIVFLSY